MQMDSLITDFFAFSKLMQHLVHFLHHEISDKISFTIYTFANVSTLVQCLSEWSTHYSVHRHGD